MKDPHIINVLHISLLKVEREVEPFSQEMESIQRFGLGFSDGRDVRGSWKGLEAGETAAGVLDEDSLFFSLLLSTGLLRLVKKEWTLVVRVFGISESTYTCQVSTYTYNNKYSFSLWKNCIPTHQKSTAQKESKSNPVWWQQSHYTPATY